MFRKIVAVSVLLVSLGVIGVCAASFGLHGAATAAIENSTAPESAEIVAATNGFSVEVLIYGAPAGEYDCVASPHQVGKSQHVRFPRPRSASARINRRRHAGLAEDNRAAGDSSPVREMAHSDARHVGDRVSWA